jgi:hypothetical protein
MRVNAPHLIAIAVSLCLGVSNVVAAERVNPRSELQLQNTTPSVKSFSIKTEGSVREQAQLAEVKNIVQSILRESQPKVVSKTVSNDPSADEAQVHNRLEIVIGATSPENDNDPYKITLTLREQGVQGKDRVQSFDFRNGEGPLLKKKLNTYLSEHLQLQPRNSK